MGIKGKGDRERSISGKRQHRAVAVKVSWTEGSCRENLLARSSEEPKCGWHVPKGLWQRKTQLSTMYKQNIFISSKNKFWKLMVTELFNLTNYLEHKFVVRSYWKLPMTSHWKCCKHIIDRVWSLFILYGGCWSWNGTCK